MAKSKKIDKELGFRLKKARLDQKLTYDELSEKSGVSSRYIKEIENSCYICNRIETVFDRYIKTVIHCYTHDDDFKKKFNESKGFCTKHYGMLYEYAKKTLNSSALNNFISDLNDIYINNFKRVTDELEWFIDKFDYKNENEPWKNSKDAIQRSILKTNGLFIE